MEVHTRRHSHANRSPDRPRNPSLIYWSQSRILRSLDLAHRCHVFRDQREVLCSPVSHCCQLDVEEAIQVDTYPIMLLGIEIDDIKNVMVRLTPSLPLHHLHTTQIMRRVHISRPPTSRNLLRQIFLEVVVLQVLNRRSTRLLLLLSFPRCALSHKIFDAQRRFPRTTWCRDIVEWVLVEVYRTGRRSRW